MKTEENTAEIKAIPPRPAPSRIPSACVVLGIIGVIIIVGPLIALGFRVPWDRLGEILTEEDTITMLKVTLYAAFQSTVITTLIGVPLAVWTNHTRRGGRVIRLLVMLPLAMPPVVGGLALTAAVGRRGYTAPILDALGIEFAFAFPGVVLAHIFVSLPFVVVSVDSALRQIDREILASAASVGMKPAAILFKITLPAIAPAIATGAGLAFARSLGEFGTTITFAGSMPGITRTMPLGIYLEREIDYDRSYVLAAILIALAVTIITLSMLPAALKKKHTPRPAVIGELDTQRMRDLTRPETGGKEVSITTLGATTVFPANHVTAVVGPNGSGKTTMSGLIAGRLRGAEVRVGDTPVDGPSVPYVSAHDRGIVLLTQRPGLPHTATVSEAVTMASGSQELTAELLDASGLNALANTPVPALSGGQAAQVALVRALAARPSVLILDEPLAAVDVASTARWRRVLRATSADRTTIVVTHDSVDIAGLADSVVVLEEGRSVAHVGTQEFFVLPPTTFASRLAGINRLWGYVSEVSGDGAVTVVSEHSLTAVGFAEEPLTAGAEAVVTCPPSDITLRLPVADSPVESARNVWTGTVLSVDTMPAEFGAGAHAVVTVDVGMTSITVPVTSQALVDLDLEPGDNVECLVKAMNVKIHPRTITANT
ncbi:ATP-binding cassette domain-containing protein [Corynebacterium renale]|uniref:ATP-binding cassette domain-containing protein n=1 Tax=Corynebacterium renale TaxID=1724 RepID=UPI00065466B7|nr:ATP-binding cassette domain-containing protein [Corynebacterium renale]